MKQKDLMVLLVIAFMAGIFALVISNTLFSSSGNKAQSVETITPISSEFPSLDKKYFNTESVDPAQQVNIGPSNNQNPFANSGN